MSTLSFVEWVSTFQLLAMIFIPVIAWFIRKTQEQNRIQHEQNQRQLRKVKRAIKASREDHAELRDRLERVEKVAIQRNPAAADRRGVTA